MLFSLNEESTYIAFSSINRIFRSMKDLMMLGWMRRMLVRAGKDAEERGYKRIDVEQLIHLDPFE